MSSDPPIALHRVAVVEDRYSGTYSGGTWWAVAQAKAKLDGLTQIDWLLEHGPGADDVTCGVLELSTAVDSDGSIQPLSGFSGREDADTDEWQPPQ